MSMSISNTQPGKLAPIDESKPEEPAKETRGSMRRRLGAQALMNT